MSKELNIQNEFDISDGFILVVIPLVIAVVIIYNSITATFPQKSLFHPFELNLQNFEDRQYFIALILWYGCILITMYQIIKYLNPRKFIVDTNSDTIIIQSKLLGTIKSFDFDEIKNIEFHSEYDELNDSRNNFEVFLLLTDKTKYRIFEGGEARYENFQRFLKKYSNLHKLIVINSEITN